MVVGGVELGMPQPLCMFACGAVSWTGVADVVLTSAEALAAPLSTAMDAALLSSPLLGNCHMLAAAVVALRDGGKKGGVVSSPLPDESDWGSESGDALPALAACPFICGWLMTLSAALGRDCERCRGRLNDV